MTSTDPRLEIIDADITTLEVDVIVNAANEMLAPGAGVCGAIHTAAGPELAEDCSVIGNCPTGEARITRGYALPAGHVIHAVGPVWYGGKSGEDALLASCYRRSMGLLVGNNLSTIAFPAISTGIFGFPADRAARIAVKTVSDFMDGEDRVKRVVFCCFGEESQAAYKAALI